MRIGIVGNGYVGQATSLLSNKDTDLYIYDIDPDKRVPNKDTTLQSVATDCDIVFVCVPTPMDMSTGRCHTNIVESVVSDLKTHNPHVDVVVRSTVPVGLCDSLNVNFMPEFLTERNWKNDVRTCVDWVIGCHDGNSKFQDKVRTLFKYAASHGKVNPGFRLHFVGCREAELCKYARNVFLSTKVSFFNEIHEFCQGADIDYESVRLLTGLDPRIGESHTQVPGPDGKKGFGGTCFPKDTSSLYMQIKNADVEPIVIDAIIRRNQTVDRPEEDWKDDKGRAVI